MLSKIFESHHGPWLTENLQKELGGTEKHPSDKTDKSQCEGTGNAMGAPSYDGAHDGRQHDDRNGPDDLDDIPNATGNALTAMGHYINRAVPPFLPYKVEQPDLGVVSNEESESRRRPIKLANPTSRMIGRRTSCRRV
jgi:hypothetical protein